MSEEKKEVKKEEKKEAVNLAAVPNDEKIDKKLKQQESLKKLMIEQGNLKPGPLDEKSSNKEIISALNYLLNNSK